MSALLAYPFTDLHAVLQPGAGIPCTHTYWTSVGALMERKGKEAATPAADATTTQVLPQFCPHPLVRHINRERQERGPREGDEDWR